MALSKRQSSLVAQIAKQYGRVLDLEKSPAVLIEILRNFGHVLDAADGTGGVSPSSIAVAGPPPPPPPPPPSGDDSTVRLADVMKAVLKLQSDVKAMSKQLADKRNR